MSEPYAGPLFKSPSYRHCDECAKQGDELHCLDGWWSSAEKPCWGEVMATEQDDEGYLLHYCRGHFGDGSYDPEPDITDHQTTPSTHD